MTAKTNDKHLHITWSIESPDGLCKCGGETVLCVAPDEWQIDSESEHCRELGGVIGVPEVSAHVCVNCRRICSLSVNEHQSELKR